MKIVNLKSENIMRLNAVEITPKGDMVIIGGKNEQGKSSVLESILLALGGRKSKIREPLKKGADKGKVVLELDGTGLIVTRTLTKSGGGALTVTGKDGAKFPSPQAMLDKISGELTFDPLAWVSMDDAKQLKVLKELTGITFDEEDKLRSEIYDNRTEANRKLKTLQAQMNAIPDHGDDIPDQEVSVSELMEELDRRQLVNAYISETSGKVEDCNAKSNGLSEDIATLKKALSSKEAELKELESQRKNLETLLKGLKTEDAAEIQDRIRSADEINKKVRQKADKAVLAGRIEKGTRIIEGMTKNLSDIDKAKQDKLANAKLPIEDLSFDESGVYYKGIPFKQASSAEALRVSVAMGIAMNPELKILLIRDGSLLDNDNLKAISEMAFDSGHQIWLEKVSENDEECSIIISDGSVKEA